MLTRLTVEPGEGANQIGGRDACSRLNLSPKPHAVKPLVQEIKTTRDVDAHPGEGSTIKQTFHQHLPGNQEIHHSNTETQFIIWTYNNRITKSLV